MLAAANCSVSLGPCRCLSNRRLPESSTASSSRRAGSLTLACDPASAGRNSPRRRPTIGFTLPDVTVRQFYLAYDGQDFAAPGLLFWGPTRYLGWPRRCRVGRSLTGSPTTARAPAGAFGEAPARDAPKRWFPIAFFQGADQLLVDTDPTDTGTARPGGSRWLLKSEDRRSAGRLIDGPAPASR